MSILPELISLCVSIVFGVGIGVPAYSKVLRILREKHPEKYEELGKPTMTMASPTRSQQLQRFLYSKAALETGDEELSHSVRFLRIFTIVLILMVFANLALVLRAVILLLNQSESG